MKNLKILIIRLSSIGDILLTTPFIRQVRNRFPNAEINYLIKIDYKDLVKDNPYIDNIISFESSGSFSDLRKLKKSIQTTNYNYIFDLHNNLRSKYLRRGLKTDFTYNIKKDKFKQIFLVYLKRNIYNKIIPIPQRYLRVAENVGVLDDEKGLEFFWNKETEKSTINIIKKDKINDKKIISIAPGATFFTKRWPVENFLKLIDFINEKFKFHICILGGPKDREISNVLIKKNNVIDYAGKLSLPETGIILAKSTALISNDTGLMHMATAVNTPVLAIFGSSVQELGFSPYRGKSIVIENENLNCRPCSHIGRNNCPKKHFLCMNDITPGQVSEKFELLLRA